MNARFRHWLGRTISRKLLVAFLLVFLVTYFATALVVQSAVRSAVTEAELGTLKQLATLKLTSLETRFEQTATNLKAWSKLDVMNDIASGDVDKRVQRTLEILKDDYALKGDLYAFDLTGRLVASSDRGLENAVLPAVWKPARQLSFIDKHVNPLAEGSVVALSMPVTSTFSGSFALGTLVLTVPWSAVREVLSGQTALVRQGPQPVVLDAALPAAASADAVLSLARTPPAGWVQIGGDRYMVNSAQSQGTLLRDWQVIAFDAPASVAHTLNGVALKLAALCVLLAVPLTLAIRWLASRLSAPLQELTRFVTGITETGDLSQRVELQTDDETGTLAAAFNRLTERLEHAYHDAVTMLSIACEGKDEDTGYHVNRVQHLTEALAIELGLPRDEARHIGMMSILHDVGKLNVPDAILKKPAKLDSAEWAVMQAHAEQGVRILGRSSFYAIAREIAISHHENWDGTGYPKKLTGEAIPLSGRIVRVADVFDALTSRRPYKEPWSVDRALEFLREQAGHQFDPQVIDAFFRMHEAGTVARILREFHG